MGRRTTWKKQYASLNGRGRCDQLVSDLDRQLNRFRRIRPTVIGCDYGVEASAEITGIAQPDGTILITGMDTWCHEIDLTADSTNKNGS